MLYLIVHIQHSTSLSNYVLVCRLTYKNSSSNINNNNNNNNNGVQLPNTLSTMYVNSEFGGLEEEEGGVLLGRIFLLFLVVGTREQEEVVRKVITHVRRHLTQAIVPPSFSQFSTSPPRG